MSGEELPRWRSAADLVIVDTRTANEFRELRIPGSVNVQPYALRTKAYLEGKHVLLMHRGGTGAHLQAVCSSLRADGFAAVGILEGGLRSWSRHGGPLAGSRTAQAALDRLSAAELARELQSGRWLVVDLSPRSTPADIDFPAVPIPFAGGPGFRRALEQAVLDHDRGGSPPFVLLTNGAGDGYEAVRAEVERLGVEHVYFLDGGADAYLRHRTQQAKIIESAERGCALNACGQR